MGKKLAIFYFGFMVFFAWLSVWHTDIVAKTWLALLTLAELWWFMTEKEKD